MNVLHMKYAVEVARCGSINRAAEVLMVGQPNISRAIKELESTLGTGIFLRTAKGMRVTAEGEIFLRYANSILKQMDEIEAIFNRNVPTPKIFSLWIRGASYIYSALGEAYEKAEGEKFFCTEADNRSIIQAVEDGESRLGIIRVRKERRKAMDAILAEKGLCMDLAADFVPCITVGKNNTAQSVEVLPSEIREEEKAESGIYIPSPEGKAEILRRNSSAFMLSVPAEKEYIEKCGLVQLACEEMPVYTDMLIRRKDTRLTVAEEIFKTELQKLASELFGNA